MLRIAILTLLADREYCGYDLSKAFDSSITHVWAASQSQIYPELHKLETNGLIDGTDVPREGRPDKRVYRITAAGREALLEWVSEAPESLTVRDPFQLRTINLGRLEPDVARALVEAQQALIRTRLATLARIRDFLEAAGQVPGEAWNDALGWRLTVEAGLRIATAYDEWCTWTIEQLAASARRRSRRRRT